MDLKRAFSWGGGYAFAIGLVAVTIVVLLPFRTLLTAPTAMLMVVPAIILIARLSGIRPAAVASVVGFLALNFLFVPPYYRLTVADYQEWIALLVFLTVALLIGQQTAQLRQRERSALDRQSELAFLNDLSSRIVSADSAVATADFIVRRLTSALGASRAVLFVSHVPGEPIAIAEAGAGGSPEELSFAAWVMRNSKAVGLGPRTGDFPAPASVDPGEAVPGLVARGIYLPLQTSDSIEGVLHVVLGSAALQGSTSRLLVAVTNLAAGALERQRLEESASRIEALKEADRLKTTLVSSVSHELKTPLAAATARVTGLIEEGGDLAQDRLRQELVAVSDDLGRLNDSIGDLLDLSRLESDAWRPHAEPHEIGDILGTMLSRFPAERRDRVRFVLPEDLPPICADFAQIARALFNLVENALDYSPSGTFVTVGAESRGPDVISWVEDEGPGVPDDEKNKVFEKFYRGRWAESAPAGTGLGLAISREIVRNNAGRIWVEDVSPHGARFLVALPTASSRG
ncbi:MAG: DUF4118 domain-containing protein [Coriobacteriales bacterium]|nr:DUF4118 domain-containing protein [Coriobacteriales bacterium]